MSAVFGLSGRHFDQRESQNEIIEAEKVHSSGNRCGVICYCGNAKLCSERHIHKIKKPRLYRGKRPSRNGEIWHVKQRFSGGYVELDQDDNIGDVRSYWLH